MESIVFLVIINIILSIIIAFEGKKRDIGFMTSFVISFLFSVFCGFMVVTLSERKTEKDVKLLMLLLLAANKDTDNIVKSKILQSIDIVNYKVIPNENLYKLLYEDLGSIKNILIK